LQRGLLGLRGAVGGDGKLFRDAAREIKSLLDEEGVGDMPLGLDVVEPPLMLELQKLGIEVRDGQQTMLAAREVKNIDELILLNMAAAMVDGVYQDIAEALKPGVKESEIVSLATARLYDMGSDCVEAINAISGERCSPHPHNFTDRLIRPGDQAFFDVIQSYMGYRTCLLPHVQRRSRDGAAARCVSARARMIDSRDRFVETRCLVRRHRTRVSHGGRHRVLAVRWTRSASISATAWGLGLARAAARVAPQRLLAEPIELKGGGWWCSRVETYLPGERRLLGRAHRGGGDTHADGRASDFRCIPHRSCQLPTPTDTLGL
jgi:hypothetical protein